MSRKNKHLQPTTEITLLPAACAPATSEAVAISQILHDGKIWDRVSIPGLASAHLVRDKIQPGTPNFQYEGPFIPLNQWREVLSYFKWANDTHSCEVQVRGFLNLELQQWKFWAFPQEKGGMTTREIAGGDADRQRAEFGSGWSEYLSAHSHCSMSAFQSGTDRNDEVGRPGLHITIGKLNDQVFDIDARATFIHAGDRVHYITIDLTQWFDMPDYMSTCPRELFRILPNETITSIHLRGITTLPSGMVEFPEQWRSNLIDRPAVASITHYHHGGKSQHGFHQQWNNENEDGLLKAFQELCDKYNLTHEEMLDMWPLAEEIRKIQTNNGFWGDWDKSANIIQAAIMTGEAEEMKRLSDAKAADQPAGGGDGIPDYIGLSFE